jgi:hypothetical protein
MIREVGLTIIRWLAIAIMAAAAYFLEGCPGARRALREPAGTRRTPASIADLVARQPQRSRG